MPSGELEHSTTLLRLLVMILLPGVGVAALNRPLDPADIDPVSLDYRIDVNRVDAATLQLLPGVGPSLAENIVRHRAGGATYDGPASLDAVHLIGPATRGRIAPFVRY